MRSSSLAALALVGTLVTACTEQDPIETDIRPADSKLALLGGGPAAPAPLQSVAIGSSALTLWPFTGSDFQNTMDPVNLVFSGVRPAALRAALMRLEGDRSGFGFPNVAPFNCKWKDAVGTHQTGYSDAGGWSASAVQLECGDYAPMRFHIRIFTAGTWSIGASHFEVLIPGTTDHEVLSWELAQQLVTVDMVRSGLLNPAQPMAMTGVINPAPSFRTINPLVYNGLPASLIGLIGGPAKPVAAPVPIASDGRATIFHVTGDIPADADIKTYQFTIPFGQFIPKPFCSADPLDYVRVDGAVTFNHRVLTTQSGDYAVETDIKGKLQVTPVNPTTNPPTVIGATREADIFDLYTGLIKGQTSIVTMLQKRSLPALGELAAESSTTQLRVGPGRISDYQVDVVCGS